jgi:3-phosphoshikimate 1-carboxyvinyltransferase
MSASSIGIVPQVSRLAGTVRVPGDKSISHRYALFAAIADGESRLQGYAPGADCAATLACLERLGVRVARGGTLLIEGRGLRVDAAVVRASGRPSVYDRPWR